MSTYRTGAYRAVLNRHIASEFSGNRREAARRWGVKYPTLANVCNGYKGMSPELAHAISVGSGFVLERDELARIKAIPGKRDRGNEGSIRQ